MLKRQASASIARHMRYLCHLSGRRGHAELGFTRSRSCSAPHLDRDLGRELLSPSVSWGHIKVSER